MIEKTTTNKILEFFFDNPTTEFYIREICRKTNISIPSVISGVKKLKKNNILTVKKTKAIKLVKANIENKKFIELKRINNLLKLQDSGFLDFLKNNFNETIVLFGSYSKGEDTERSDIDIAIINSEYKNLDLTKFEKKLNRNINLHFVEYKTMKEDFYNSLCNGIVLNGYLSKNG
ncbi:nucleotidyltransferase domain-containing protein [Candidatus Woesearchaeota archaeon]|nr:nucleotidyltransferase domain-containing protein [Candidatus Woesearchaeota archaeon]